jgi:hypothetical protein
VITPPLCDAKSGTWVSVPPSSGLAATASPPNVCLRMLLVACTGSPLPLELLHGLPKNPSVTRLMVFCAPHVTLFRVEPTPPPPDFFSEPAPDAGSCEPPCSAPAASALGVSCAGAATAMTITMTAAQPRSARRIRGRSRRDGLCVEGMPPALLIRPDRLVRRPRR